MKLLPKERAYICMNCHWMPPNPRKFLKKCKRCENIGCLVDLPLEEALQRAGVKNG